MLDPARGVNTREQHARLPGPRSSPACTTDSSSPSRIDTIAHRGRSRDCRQQRRVEARHFCRRRPESAATAACSVRASSDFAARAAGKNSTRRDDDGGALITSHALSRISTYTRACARLVRARTHARHRARESLAPPPRPCTVTRRPSVWPCGSARRLARPVSPCFRAADAPDAPRRPPPRLGRALGLTMTSQTPDASSYPNRARVVIVRRRRRDSLPPLLFCGLPLTLLPRLTSRTVTRRDRAADPFTITHHA